MKFVFKTIKNSILFIVGLVFVSICLLVYLLNDEMSDFYNLWTVESKESTNYSSEEFNKFYTEFKSLKIQNNKELNDLKPELYYHLENISGLEERKVFNEYINKLNLIKEIASGSIAIYEFDIYKHLNEENKKFSKNDILSIENKDFLKVFLVDLIVEGNHKIVKEDYLEIYQIEIDYEKLILEFEMYLDVGFIEELQDLKNSSKQINLRNRVLYF